MKLLFQSFISILTILKKGNFKYFNFLNKTLYSSENRTLVILGNGPSLKKDIEEITNQPDTHYSVVNNHVLSDSYTVIKPLYYTLMDPYFLDNEKGKATVSLINEKTSWKMYLIILRKKNWINTIKPLITNSNITVIAINAYPPKGYWKLKSFFYSKNLGIPRIQNVLAAAIYCGICANYKSINLLGVDHSWLSKLFVNSNNEICLKDDHFYDKKEATITRFGKPQYQYLKYHDVVMTFSRMFKSYWELRRYADECGITIFNCTEDSFIDAFERKKLDL